MYTLNSDKKEVQEMLETLRFTRRNMLETDEASWNKTVHSLYNGLMKSATYEETVEDRVNVRDAENDSLVAYKETTAGQTKYYAHDVWLASTLSFNVAGYWN